MEPFEGVPSHVLYAPRHDGSFGSGGMPPHELKMMIYGLNLANVMCLHILIILPIFSGLQKACFVGSVLFLHACLLKAQVLF